jgi:uncharacterized protein YndB with AHSA1/START domain
MTESTTVEVQRHVAAPVEAVYEAWTDPGKLATWWWPERFETAYELDVREGGRYEIRSSVAGFGVHGRYLLLDPPHRLELSWVWEDDGTEGPEEQVVVELSGTATGTLVTVRHTTEAAGAADFRQGWTDCLDRLLRWAEGGISADL